MLHDDELTRNINFTPTVDKIHVAIGMRRVGKTTCILQRVKQLVFQNHIPLSQILYLNLEDVRIQPCTQNKLRSLIDKFYVLYPENHDKTCYLFLDEIQVAEDWQVLLRRILDTKNVQIFLTGSSAKLLSKEIHTSLRGQTLAYEAWPFDFNEYLQSSKVSFKSNVLGQKNRDIVGKYLQDYLTTGGFPSSHQY